jgi:hypothetical protein
MNPDGSDGMALTMITRQIQLAMVKGTDPEVIERLMRLHGHARGILDEKRVQQAPPQPPMGPGAPMTDATGPAPGPMPAVPPPGPVGNPDPMQAMQ